MAWCGARIVFWITLASLVAATPSAGEVPDGDELAWDNCPRPLEFWRGVYDPNPSGNEASGVTPSQSRTIARRVDEVSTYFNWANDVEGMRQALGPGTGRSPREQVSRQYAVLLANVAAGELGLASQDGEGIGLDLETRVDYGGARTLRELIALTDRMLRGSGRNETKLNAALTGINRGRGIGVVCE
jgi:hypothetical protein